MSEDIKDIKETQPNITIEDLKKLVIKMGKIENCDRVEKSEKMLRLEIDFGSEIGRRQILTGMAKFYEPTHFIGKTLPFIVNLEPRKMLGLESQGMILAIDGPEGPVLLISEKDVTPGSDVI